MTQDEQRLEFMAERRQEILPPADKPLRYRPPGDGDMRDKLLAAREVFEGDRKVAYALAMCVRLLRTLGKNSPGPTQKHMCEAYVDIFEEVIPEDMRQVLRDAAANVGAEE